MDIKPVNGQLRNNFSGQAANEELPLHEKLLACLALEHESLVQPFRHQLIDIFKQMNLWTAQARQSPAQHGLDEKWEDVIVTESFIGIWLSFSPEAWDKVIDSYMDDLRQNDPARFAQIHAGVNDAAADQEKLRLAFEEDYKDKMTALHDVAGVMQNHLPGVQAQILIGHLEDEIGRPYVQPVMKLSAPENVDLRDIVRAFIERKTLRNAATPT